MKLVTPFVKKAVFFLLLTFSALSASDLMSQSIDGIYSDGNVSLHLEEVEDGVVGLFADSDGSYYEAVFIAGEEGLMGMVGEYFAFIPWESEVMTLYVMPMDQNEEPIWDEAVPFELEYVSGLNDESEQVDVSRLSWSPIKRFGKDFYPSYVLATSTWSEDIVIEQETNSFNLYGDRNGYFGVKLDQFPIGTIVRFEVSGEPLVKKSSYTITITKPGITEIFPILEYDYEALKAVNQAKPVNFKYALYANNQLVGEKLEVVWTRSINDAVFFGIDHYGNERSLNFIFAAYVNENEPSLDPILGQMLDYKIVNSWIGYQGTEEDVLKQVFTLWYHFQRKGFRYSSITTQSGTDQRSAGQVIRFVGDALQTSQANCIDGTVLFASFLYKIGIDVSIVLVPGHAYLAFGLTEDGSRKVALETTMMGNLDIKHTNAQQDLYNTMNGLETSDQKSWSSFLGALNAGTENYYSEAIPGINAGNPQYMEINIKTAREQQIRPIK